ncbi:MAG: EF2563 family selenium-dependent molybdenum hydroxylase system protein [Lachnospiraceae bacterium]|nr:EF2563 family selenium-dependent molybdenum hydroxylase system protein [Lachnospiraceae bacterium]
MAVRVLIRGAGDIASGIALRLHRAGMEIIMTETACPTTIRRTVAFSGAVTEHEQKVEDITAVLADTAEEALKLVSEKKIPVLIDPGCDCRKELSPDVVVDAILAKRNLGTDRTFAPVVIGVGPGFTAGEDCHAVIETMRGHTLGRVYYKGSALPNTNIPGLIGGFAGERVLRAPDDGKFTGIRKIGDMVEAGETVGTVNGIPMKATISGVLRGLLADGVSVKKGMKSGDVDPRGEKEYCNLVSDKALSVAGGVLEAIMHFGSEIGERN